MHRPESPQQPDREGQVTDQSEAGGENLQLTLRQRLLKVIAEREFRKKQLANKFNDGTP